MQPDFKHDLGDKVRDSVTGFQGIVTCRSEHLNGCKRYGVQAQKLKDNKPAEAEWIDEAQLTSVSKCAVEVKKTGTEGPFRAPKPMSNPR